MKKILENFKEILEKHQDSQCIPLKEEYISLCEIYRFLKKEIQIQEQVNKFFVEGSRLEDLVFLIKHDLERFIKTEINKHTHLTVYNVVDGSIDENIEKEFHDLLEEIKQKKIQATKEIELITNFFNKYGVKLNSIPLTKGSNIV